VIEAPALKRPAAHHLDELNAGQRAAAEYGIAPGARKVPPLLIIAGAGTGKTKTLAHRVAHLVLSGAHPGRILLLTFARRMAFEMTRRVEFICASANAGRTAIPASSFEWSGTFHAVGARLLRLYAHCIGLEPNFSILDRGDAADLLDLVRDDLGFAQTRGRARFPKKGTCLAIYSHAVNARAPLKDTLDRAFPWCADWESELTALFGHYVAAKQAQGVLDYDDLLLYWARMMEVEEVARLVAGRFDHILVDEYQDTNGLQAGILLGLAPQDSGLTAVGDDAQAIYSFRAATVRNILDFPQAFTPPAAVLKLEQNYRSSAPILDACNRVIGHARERYTKDLFSKRSGGARPVIAMVPDEAAQVQFVIDRILANREAGMKLQDQAVLMRASHHSSQLEVELTRRNIPFVKFGGLKFLEAAHVKDVLSILRWAENPRDQVAALRVLKFLPGVGPAIARRAFDAISGNADGAGPAGAGTGPAASLSGNDASAAPLGAAAASGVLFGPVTGFAALAGFPAPPAAQEAWAGLAALMLQLAGSRLWQGDLARVRAWYDPLLELLYDSAQTRLSDLDQLEHIAAGHRSRSAFLTDLALDPPEATGGEAGAPLKDEDWLVLSTIHSAKGQEWRAVAVLNVVDGCVPVDLATGTPEEVEEERRLLYVAMTRAKDDLVLMQPLRYLVRGQSPGGGKHIYAPRSRFITDADLPAFDIVGMPGDGGPGQMPVKPVKAADLKAAMRDMWK
jgi:DNA helicase-2/ATP-dependent DNA helicase PcrA